MYQHSEPSIVSIFYAYASKDEELLGQLEKQMSPLRRNGNVVDWSKRQLSPGIHRDQIIKQQLHAAHIVLLLVSPDFLASESCMREAQEALQLQTSQATIVCPILLRPVDWQQTPFAHLQCLPFNQRPIVLWKNRDAAFQEIVEGIHRMIEKMPLKRETTSQLFAPDDTNTASSASPPRLLYKYELHTHTPVAVKWSPDGKHIASSGLDQTVHIWQANTGQHMLIYREHSKGAIPVSAVWVVRWSPDSTRIASAGNFAHVRVWNAMNGQTTISYTNYAGSLFGTYSLSWSPDGTRIVSTNNTSINENLHVFDTNDGHTLRKINFHKVPGLSPASCVDWSSDGTRIVACWGKYVQICHAHSGKCILRYNEHNKWIVRLAWSPNTHSIASADARQIHVWNATTGTTLQRYIAHKGEIRDLVWSPSGEYIATASEDRTVHIWKAATGEQQYIYTGHQGKVVAVTWSPDGTRIASASEDKTIHVWRTMLDA